MKVEEQYFDVLQNMESAIVAAFHDHPDLTDYDVMGMLEALIDVFTAQKIGRSPRQFNLSDNERLMMENVQTICEWRLGRGDLGDRSADDADDQDSTPQPITIDEVILCLKRILKSVNKWNKAGGRQGYLNFVVKYVV